MFTGLAPSARKVSMKMGLPTTRILSPLMSSGLLMGPLLVVISRKPFSAQPMIFTPFFSMASTIILPDLPAMTASMAL